MTRLKGDHTVSSTALNRELDRRTLLRTAAATGAAVTLASMVPALGARAEAASQIRWLEYTHMQKPVFTEPFEKETGIELVKGAIQNDDTTLAMLKAGGTESWDVFHMGDLKNHPILVRDGLVQPLDYGQIPNSEHILPVFRTFIEKNMSGPEGAYGVPSRWGVDTIGYRTDKLDPPESVQVLWDEKYKGKIAMPDYALYDIVYAAQYLGYPREQYYRLTSAQLQECKKALIAQKPVLAGYWLSDADVINLWTSDEIWLAGALWAGTTATLRGENFPVARTVPKEGAPGFINVAYVSAGAEPGAVEAAYKFFDYLLGPVYGELIGTQGRYATVTAEGQGGLSEEIKEEIFLKYVDNLDTLVDFMLPPVNPDTGELNYDEWVTVWNEVKAA
jgi:spermidine/putrescine transport system substrate-binding protein